MNPSQETALYRLLVAIVFTLMALLRSAMRQERRRSEWREYAEGLERALMDYREAR